MQYKYKYKKWQIGKPLNVPKEIKIAIYACKLSFEDFIKYGLEDKVPISCLTYRDKEIVERFGIDKAKTLDWELIQTYSNCDIYYKLMEINPTSPDINKSLYEKLVDYLDPIYYSSQMKEKYPDRFFDIHQEMPAKDKDLMERYNNGKLNLVDIVLNWDLFKDKNLGRYSHLVNITAVNIAADIFQTDDLEKRLRYIMNTYGDLIKSIELDKRLNFFNKLFNLLEQDKEKKFIFEELFLINSISYFKDFTNEDYKKIFKIFSLRDYFYFLDEKRHYFFKNGFLADSLENLPEDYIFNISIPFELWKEDNVRDFVSECGIKNIVDFDIECGQFFSRNNFEILKARPFKKVTFSRDKEQFYENMREMIISGADNEFGEKKYAENKKILANYQYINGEFREKYPDLFIAEDAPEELKQAFYMQTITPQLITAHPEYISWLEDKNVVACFENKTIILNNRQVNIYDFLSQKMNFKDVINFIVDYGNVLEWIYDNGISISLNNSNADVKTLKYEFLRLLQFHQHLGKTIPKNIPSDIGEFLLDNAAPKELKQAFYDEKITPELITKHPEYIPWLQNKDLRDRFKSITIELDDGSKKNIWGRRGVKLDLYNFLYERMKPNILLDFFVEYKEILEYLIVDQEYYRDYIELSLTDDLEKVQETLLKITRLNLIYNTLLPNGEVMCYPKEIPKKMLQLFPTMFLEKNAPDELKQAVYNRTINSEFIKKHPEYHEHLKKLDLSVIFSPSFIDFVNEKGDARSENFIEVIEQLIGKEEAFNIMLIYGEYIEQLYDINELKNLKVGYNFSKNDILREIDSTVLKVIVEGKINYNDDLPEHFKINNPTLFLADDVPADIRNKFYNKELNLNDFNNNPNLLDLLGNTNISLGFSSEFSWIFPFFSEETNGKTANAKRLKIILAYSKVQDESLKKVFKDFMVENINDFDMKKLPYVEELLSRISKTNSTDLLNIGSSLASNLLKTDNPLDNFSEIEKLFVKNNIPLFGKIFMSFQILYPDLVKIKNDVNKFDFTDDSRMSPELKEQSLGNVRFGKTSNEKRFNIIFNDLLRIAYRSNNRSFMDYLENIEMGNNLYLNVVQGQIDINKLEPKEKEVLDIFAKHLQTLFENTVKGSKEIVDLEKYSLIERIEILSKLFGVNKNYDLKDRIVRSFCYSAGIKSFDELKQLALSATKEADARGRRYARELEGDKRFNFENGDFVRCIGDYQVLSKSLNNGNVSKEFLSVFTGKSESDTTPLDVDFSLIMNASNDTTIYDLLATGSAKATGFGFGNIYVIIKKDNPHFYITRDKDGNLTHQQYNPLKNELFGTKVADTGKYEGHWGEKTGFAYTDVDFILYKKNLKINERQPYDENGNINYVEENSEDYDDLPAIKFEIARNGYYIPVIDFSGRLIFTEKEYDDLRKKMAGLSYYRVSEYTLSNNLDLGNEMNLKDEILASQIKIQNNNGQLGNMIIDVLKNEGLTVYMGFNPDLTENAAELYSTGSTARNTNIPYDSDFDFLIRIDRETYYDEQKLNKLKSKFKEKMGLKDGFGGKVVGTIQNDEGDLLDIEISFVPRTDKLDYSTDAALSERLSNIQKQYPEQYEDVIANIVFAKKLLKEKHVYKTAKSDATQGGMGGVGLENWILQHGGSFYDAAISFLEAAEGKSFEEFIKIYQVWDFGSNHYSEKKGIYPHENFIYETTKDSTMLKMTEDGYNKMVQVLREYVNNYNQTQTVSMKK